ncbi:MAG: DUF3109 family protein, partial [Flavobacteriales bacterium]
MYPNYRGVSHSGNRDDRMILVGQTVVSQELFEQFFACDLAACKGACCIEGDGGAPLEE